MGRSSAAASIRFVVCAAVASLFFGVFPSGCAETREHEVHVRIKTDMGDIDVALFPDRAPLTVQNFLANVDAGFYEGAAFYRAARPGNQPNDERPMVLIQGGDIERGEARPTVAHETTEMSGLSHHIGTISMARFAPGTASTEFFISLGDNTRLDYVNEENPGYAAFGRVTAGLSVAAEILARPTGNRRLTEYEASIAPSWLVSQLLDENITIRTIVRLDAAGARAVEDGSAAEQTP